MQIWNLYICALSTMATSLNGVWSRDNMSKYPSKSIFFTFPNNTSDLWSIFIVFFHVQYQLFPNFISCFSRMVPNQLCCTISLTQTSSSSIWIRLTCWPPSALASGSLMAWSTYSLFVIDSLQRSIFEFGRKTTNFFYKKEAESMTSQKDLTYQIWSQFLPTETNVLHRLQPGHFTFAYLLQFPGDWWLIQHPGC